MAEALRPRSCEAAPGLPVTARPPPPPPSPPGLLLRRQRAGSGAGPRGRARSMLRGAALLPRALGAGGCCCCSGRGWAGGGSRPRAAPGLRPGRAWHRPAAAVAVPPGARGLRWAGERRGVVRAGGGRAGPGGVGFSFGALPSLALPDVCRSLRAGTAQLGAKGGALEVELCSLPAGKFYQHAPTETSQATLASVSPVFAVMKFDKEGNTTYFEKKKTELYQELGLQARDLRFQHVMSIATRNNRIIMRMEFLKAVITPEFLLILDYRNLSLEHWLLNELASQLAGEGQLVTYSLPFEFRAIEAILQYWISKLQGRLNTLQPQILETLEALVDPKLLSVDRSKLHILLQNGKSLSELETDVKVFKETILEILDEEEVIEELCLSKWTDPQVFEESTSGIDHAEEMELLLENYYRQAEDLLNEARELRVLIDDSESIIFINLDSHRNVMMRLNLQLTMGTFSVSLFGLIGVAFGMNLESSLEEDPRIFWLVTGIMFLGSGLIWRRLLSFLGRHLDPPLPPHVPAVLKKPQPATGKVEMKTSLKGETFGLSRSTLTNQ
ncbi:magnesium transporter MRS2 homolog, mitochondrial [Sylvia atricapilla]|uniref:magnesium transporter MRS2 homolog, mitochondrial n=1 Tax=Sylvia atricapilla TaxID=48155 RepID=UPI003395B5FD